MAPSRSRTLRLVIRRWAVIHPADPFVEFLGDCNLSRFTRHLFLAILLEAVVGQDGPFAFRLRACPVAGFFVSDGS